MLYVVYFSRGDETKPWSNHMALILSTFHLQPLIETWLVVDLCWEYVSAIQVPGKGCRWPPKSKNSKRTSAWLISGCGLRGGTAHWFLNLVQWAMSWWTNQKDKNTVLQIVNYPRLCTSTKEVMSMPFCKTGSRSRRDMQNIRFPDTEYSVSIAFYFPGEFSVYFYFLCFSSILFSPIFVGFVCYMHCHAVHLSTSSFGPEPLNPNASTPKW